MQIKFILNFTIASSLFCLQASSQQFYNPLIIPPVLTGPVINLTVASAVQQFYPGINTTTWGYNGTFLGPTLILNQGDSIDINVTNNLTDTTTAHWHGLIVPSEYDGGPHSPILPGNTWSVHFRILNQASTHWYHPHGNMQTTRQVTNGLAGMIVVKDTVENKLNLPRTYGIDDIPIILQDKKYDSTGNFMPVGLGDSMLVNGTAHPFVNLPAQVIRLRNLNASAGRYYNIGFSDNRNFNVIASDASLLEKPYLTNRILIGSSERYEILLDLSTDAVGDSLFLMSYGSEMAGNVPGGGNFLGEESPLNAVDFAILKINIAAQTASPVTSIPSSLISLFPIDTTQIKRTRNIPITGMGMVGSGLFNMGSSKFNMGVINDTVISGNIEKWVFTNSSNLVHPMHIHGVSFYILNINGSPPPPYMAGWKDVFNIRPNILPNESVSLIMKFGDYTDTLFPYMYHCHLLRHEDMGMMQSFIVIPDNNTSVNDPENNVESTLVYPNPSNGIFTVLNSDRSLTTEKNHLAVFDIYGSELKNEYINLPASVDISRFAGGMFFLRITKPSGYTEVKKILKE